TVATYPARSESSTIGEPAETVQHPTQSNELRSPLRPGTASEPRHIVESAPRAALSRPAGDQARHDPLEQAVQVPRPLVAPQAERAVPDSRRDPRVQSYVALIHPQRSEARSTRPETPQFPTEARSIREAS